jgi:hypothetical protein
MGIVFAGCFKLPSIVVDELLEPLASPQPWLPNPADQAAARLARAALVTRAPAATDGEDPKKPRAAAPRVEAALVELEALGVSKTQRHLKLLAVDVRNATLDDPIAYRAASRALRSKRGLDPRLKGRLDRTIGDDPLRLAGRRQFDGWHRLWARTFNAVIEPIGNSAITGFALAPFQLANSLIHYFAEFSNSVPLSLTDRQALALRQQYVAQHPDSPITPKVELKIERDLPKLEKTLARQRMDAADAALKGARPGLALHQAKQATLILADHPDLNKKDRKRSILLTQKAEAAIQERHRLKTMSLEARPPEPKLREIEVRLSTALLTGPVDPDIMTPLVVEYRATADDGDNVGGRSEFIRALAQLELGHEAAARKQLDRIARLGPEHDTMARHAQALLDDDWQNPFGAFERLRRKGARDEVGWRLAGEWINRPRYPNLPAPVAYLIDTPTIAITIILAPLRLMISPWTGAPDFKRPAALAGYRYLVRFPAGEEQHPLVDWLFDYESGRKRWGRALRMADLKTEFDSERRIELVEKTADERLERVDRLDRRDSRDSILRGIAQEFPDSDGGQDAGLRARAERKDASPQYIRITKAFLLENPAVAGPEGMGLNPKLLNDDPADAELHPEGVVLRGGRTLEIRLVAEGGKKKGAPVTRVRKISKKRLMQIASSLDEAVQRNSLIDEGSRFAADSNRDVYLERAGLGLTDEPDVRPTAQSSFVYQSLSERYGIVRGRDSVLPFDLVFRGSLGDFTMGAFPRWRMPKATPDAFLYR